MLVHTLDWKKNQNKEKMMSSNTLKDRINVVKHDTEEPFVGIKADGNEALVYFPLGYNLSETDDEIRRDILQLFSILDDFNNPYEGFITEKSNEETVNADFPLNAYMEVMRYYLENGYYTEVEPVYKTRERGKINWSKTIKQQKPFLSSNKKSSRYSPVYTKFTVKLSTPDENKEITKIHQHCVRISFERIGWIFTSFMPIKPEGRLNKDRSLALLRSKLANTNNDNKKRLFQAMIEMIESVDEDEPNNRFHFGVKKFAKIWEGLIDNVFGTEDKTEYYPRAHWILEGKIDETNQPLQPDSIMHPKDSDNYFVLDAKYYRYGDSKYPEHLPQNTDINKQITYAEYLEISKRIKSDNIYNAFLIPFNMENKETFHSNNPFINIGEAVSKWRKNNKRYEHIQGILVDTKFLMNSYKSNSASNIMELATVIEDACKNNSVYKNE